MENNTNKVVPAAENTVPATQTVTPAAAQPAPRKKRVGLFIGLGAAALVIIIAVVSVLGTYSSAMGLYEKSQYSRAKQMFSVFEFIPQFGEMAKECDYAQAGVYAKNGQYFEASQLYHGIRGYKDSAELTSVNLYAHGESLIESGKYQEARDLFIAMGDYKDAATKANEAVYAQAEAAYEKGKYIDARELFEELGDYEDAAERAVDCDISMGIDLYEMGRYEEAASVLKDYCDEYEIAEMYIALSAFWVTDELEFDDMCVLHDRLLKFAGDSEVDFALAHPFFFYARFFDVEWRIKNTRYSIDAEFDCDTVYFDLPWDVEEGNLSYRYNDEYFCIEVNGDRWFTITGFDSYDELHPDEMYIEDPDGNAYTMYKYFEY